ncbi:hypothetical protein PI124_g2157 [Phytophthora idaei]|nr:hypothetical protein PI125_g1801 [Phytophthora idaei]KAG3253255.1 hypothetical protein PI124_g2157 [Phytophthora idaei]
MKLTHAFVLLSFATAAVQAKPSSSISSLEEFWVLIAVVYAAVLVPHMIVSTCPVAGSLMIE